MPTKEALQRELDMVNEHLTSTLEKLDAFTKGASQMCHASALSDAYNKLSRVVDEKKTLQARCEIYEEALQAMTLRIKMMHAMQKPAPATPTEMVERYGFEIGTHKANGSRKPFSDGDDYHCYSCGESFDEHEARKGLCPMCGKSNPAWVR